MAEMSRKDLRKRRKRRKKVAKNFLYILFITAISLMLFLYLNEAYLHIDGVPTFSQLMQSAGLRKRPIVHVEQDEIAVHFLDVGQGDCALIKTPEKNLLIDCGEESESGYVIQYLRDFGVTRLDYVIATHPHSDHIGGMHRILSSFDVGEVIIPEVDDEQIPTTAFYEKMLDVIEKKNIGAFYAIQGQEFELCKGTVLKILGPLGHGYEDLNDYSVVAKVESGNYSFLFTGDMEKISEHELLDVWIDVRADVLKVAHHGSSSSSTTAFLKRVGPQYAVISVGEDNSYGHPADDVLERLKLVDADVLTTTEYGDIVFITDGNELRYTTTSEKEAA
ncbi:MAG: MBL fold metallo-hydrolase [Oscillospiraceae bacterium]|nr:MBL fold metallo-hydrolase [Oscillospiraceae bacterium]